MTLYKTKLMSILRKGDTMAVTVTENGRLFTIHTANSTYQMKADKYGVLLHLYYGRRSGGSMEYLLTYADRGFASNIYDCGRDRTYSLDLLPQERIGNRRHEKHGPYCGIRKRDERM